MDVMRLSTRIKALALIFSNAAAAIIIGLFVTAAPAPALAGTTIDDAVILDPYDPTPGIGFGCDDGCGYRHCYSGCYRHCYNGCRRGGCYDGCRRYRGCEDGCRSSYRCEHDCYADRDRCGDGCHRDNCGDGCHREGCGNDCDGSTNAIPCTSDHCYNAERWERRWRDGDRSGHEWYRAGSNQRDKSDDHQWDDGQDSDWDGQGPPPPPPPPPPMDDGHHHH
jgi:hypothetical protein